MQDVLTALYVIWITGGIPFLLSIATGMTVWNKTKSDGCTYFSAVAVFFTSQFVLGSILAASQRLEFILHQLYRMN